MAQLFLFEFMNASMQIVAGFLSALCAEDVHIVPYTVSICRQQGGKKMARGVFTDSAENQMRRLHIWLNLWHR